MLTYAVQDEASRARLAQVVKVMDNTGCSRDAYRALARLTPEMEREYNGMESFIASLARHLSLLLLILQWRRSANSRRPKWVKWCPSSQSRASTMLGVALCARCWSTSCVGYPFAHPNFC
jgi:hypothetical protein